MKNTENNVNRPNILLIMADQYRFPRYDKNHGMREPIKKILGFQGKSRDLKPYAKYFPGLVRLRENAVVLRNHTIAASACIPSRAALFTGQYGARTGVTQTDGVFKGPDQINWLETNGIPTMGDWFRASGYSTHYFGKCHFAHPPDHSLQEFGFDNWEQSYPEPHGTEVNNLGFYRDHGFADLVTTFLKGKGLALDYDRQQADGNENGESQKPWFAVASFTNPHDIVAYPQLNRNLDPNAPPIGPLPVPKQGDKSVAPIKGTWEIPLNPNGFPQKTASLPPTFNEDLATNNKPDCQLDYSLKLGIALASTSESLEIATHAPGLVGQPVPLAKKPAVWSEVYLQYYTYLHTVLDQHIDRVMKTLDETGLAENTIVIFAPDHGEHGAAHGKMLQKWHSAYQEAIHVPVVVCLPKDSSKKSSKGIKDQIGDLTSHIDMLPTILGLAGIGEKERKAISKLLQKENHNVVELPGADLSGIITGTESGPVQNPDGTPREGILFVTSDAITEPGNVDDPDSYPISYQVYLEAVETYIHTDKKKWKPITDNMVPGPVRQPSHLHCVRHKNWKLVKYFDPSGEHANQWEMYNLKSDPNEKRNLLVYNEEFPTPVHGLKEGKIVKKAKELDALLTQLEQQYLDS